MSGIMDSRHWEVLPADEDSERMLQQACGVSPLVARVLSSRGIRDAAEAQEFLSPSLDRDWADPLDIPGMREAADRVELALSRGERIAVFGDFDVDGMTSTCLLTKALRRLGGEVFPYIPHRFGEGYGLSKEALDRVISGCDPQLIVTVDNGIAAKNEVAGLLEHGVDVVVTDHHEPGELVPEGVPVTDPKLDSESYSRELAGAGVALKLVCELGRRLGQPDLWREYTDVASMGTVSDMMLLQGENRALVADGMERMHHSSMPGIVALAATAGVDLAELTADSLPFSLVPRLNAAGRMGTTDVAFDLLITDDPAEATVLAGRLEETNNERRRIEAELTEQAMARIEESYDGGRVIVLGGEGWHEGVKGIVASRIVNKYHVPTILFSIKDGIARGSGRSVGQVDLFHALEQCSDVLVRFGGHSGAVGVTCEESRLDELRERLEAVLADLPEEDFEDREEISAVVGLGELTQEAIDSLETLQPFGRGNKRPYFAVRGVCMRNRTRVGFGGNHLRFLASDGANCVPAIMFRTPNVERASACEGAVDLVFDAINETWQGRTKPKLMVKDIVYRDGCDEDAGCLCDEEFEALGNPGAPGDRTPASEPDAKPAADELRALGPQGLTQELVRRMIGDNSLLPAQELALSQLGDGRSTLCVMATGRGKSLIFHVHAAREALLNGLASVFVYPLRALVSDQSFHLGDAFASMGLTVRVLTGETPPSERDDVFSGLASGSCDVILTTPEFLSIHSSRFAESGRVGFVVVDEAHHAGLAKGGDRSAYTELPRILDELGDPTVLAVTATAEREVADEVCRLCGIDRSSVVVDVSVRSNLRVVDHRELRDREAALVSIVAGGEKTVVYVNSREQSVSLARLLRRSIPDLGQRIAFYNAGLARQDRRRVEEAFRDGRLSCIVTTSAFGEGVNLPDVRNVVLYHMPFGSIDFNQMSGRAGRDGSPAMVHLLFCGRDARINERLLASSAPSRDDMAALYRALAQEARTTGGWVSSTDALLAQAVLGVSPQSRLDESGVEAGIAVFEELGFLSTTGFAEARRIHMVAHPKREPLDSSIRYLEGMRSQDEFLRFCDWALNASAQELLDRIDRPIVPGFGTVVDQ